MPLTAEQEAAVATIAGADVEEITEALKNSANPIYNRVFGAGVTTGKSQVQTKLDTLTTELETAKTEAGELQTQLDDLKAKTPDRAEIDTQWQAKLDRDVAKATEKLTAAEQKVARLTTDTTVEKAENALLAAGIRPRIAKLLAKDAAARVRYDDNGNPVLYEGELPVQVPAGKTAFQVLAEQEKQQADPADLVSNVDTGGGARGGGGEGRPDGDVRKSVDRTASYTL